jgi:competence transcription factor ComK
MTAKAKAKKLQKPVKKTDPAYYDFYEVMHYLEELHGKNFRDYAGKFASDETVNVEVPYQDFWHWMLDQNEVKNGCWIHLPDWDYYMNSKSTESWKKEIMQYFKDFLGDSYDERMWCEW